MYFLMPPCLEQEIKIETYWNVNDIDVDFETERRQELK